MKVNIALLTVTDTRTFENDKSGGILVKKIEEANHNLADRKRYRCNYNNWWYGSYRKRYNT
jgi:molybdopterin biosynthesis enzyme MoaB